MAKTLMKGNEAVGKAAILAGCTFFAGYPITPQNEVPEYLSRELPKAGGTFIQSESEVAAINMLYGAGGSGARCMTSSSSPGIALKQEGIGYCVFGEIPCVINSVSRGGLHSGGKGRRQRRLSCSRSGPLHHPRGGERYPGSL